MKLLLHSNWTPNSKCCPNNKHKVVNLFFFFFYLLLILLLASRVLLLASVYWGQVSDWQRKGFRHTLHNSFLALQFQQTRGTKGNDTSSIVGHLIILTHVSHVWSIARKKGGPSCFIDLFLVCKKQCLIVVIMPVIIYLTWKP